MSSGARTGRFEIRQQKDGKFYFVLRAGNGEIIAQGMPYERKESCRTAITLTRDEAGIAEIDDTTA